ncbi:MAG: site-specific integrase [Candidatus Thiodiazotropha sp.]|nr:site-specific integrase [Candidatus Thiodiazotropha sp.]MCM8883786.1 site-specific integrase [Candidatus Thiodiazotropha sp.]MCM8922305.1 site-specific integrase [Candidatus Thiodiazotropha sp.]
MGSIRIRTDTGLLFFDFRYQGRRCREQTMLKDNSTNRKRLEKVLSDIEKEIADSSFEYRKYFPNSKNLKHFLEYSPEQINSGKSFSQGVTPNSFASDSPSFNDFSDTWVSENEIGWRRSHHKTQMDIISGHLKPVFGDKAVSRITKAEILAFRASLAKVPGRKGNGLSPKRINAIMGPLRQILNEAADRYEFNTPYRNIKPLKVPKSDVEPFTLEEVSRLLATVRADFCNYYTVRFFTGMRTGEIDGLKWQYIDFDKRLILIRETIVLGEEDYTKTDGSQREIQMSQVVFDALKAQEQATCELSKFVFCTKNGEPLDHNNVTKRVWYPLLSHLGLMKRRPYQSRHTAATLWLAAGENPEWIACQMGHTSTEMLFRVYSRFVPNLTRQDGSAFERLLTANLTAGGTHHVTE